MRAGAQLREADLLAHRGAHLAGFKVPDRMQVRETLPRNPSAEALKRVLREELAVPAPSGDRCVADHVGWCTAAAKE